MYISKPQSKRNAFLT